MYRTRDYRRHQLEKRKKNVRRWHWFLGKNCQEDVNIGIWAKTPKRCSCFMCGNHRKWDGITISEARLGLDLIINY